MKLMIAALALLTSASAFAQDFDLQDRRGGGRDRERGESILCESHDYRYNTCRVGRFRDAYLQRQESRKSACIEGETWGMARNYIWVDGGCRGVFRIIR